MTQSVGDRVLDHPAIHQRQHQGGGADAVGIRIVVRLHLDAPRQVGHIGAGKGRCCEIRLA